MEDNTQVFRELQSGTTLCNGKYVIEKKIGAGGFGITYKARHPLLDHVFAIKEFFIAGQCIRHTQSHTVLLQGLTEEVYDRYRQSFIREARTLAKLDHPGIVKVVDVFDENNTSYFAMPFVAGKTLQQIVEDSERKRLDYPVAVNYIGQIAEAVSYIHEHKILHRDIKPENVIVTPEDKTVLIDFGSAREFINDQTQHHTTMLTHGYAPIEQYASLSRKGAYSDIYALGAVFYFLLTGQTPISATDRSMRIPLPAPNRVFPDIPEAASRTIMKAMQMESENRHQSIAEFMDDLLNRRPSTPVSEKSATVAEPKKTPVKTTAPAKPPKTPKRGAGLKIALAVVVVLLVIGGTGWWLHSEKLEHIEKDFNEARTKAFENFNNTPRRTSSALDFCNQALKIKPDDPEMSDLKVQIEQYVVEREKKFAADSALAVDAFEIARSLSETKYYLHALSLCDSALKSKRNSPGIDALKKQITEEMRKMSK
jgi:serine/threonine protein kinase